MTCSDKGHGRRGDETRWWVSVLLDRLVYGVLIALVCWMVLGWCRHARSREEARRTQCRFNLVTIHRAIERYADENGAVPDSLSELVSAGFLEEGSRAYSLVCPSGRLLFSEQEARYEYHSEAWGATDQPVVTENCENHTVVERSNALTRLIARPPFVPPPTPVCFALFADESVRNVAR